jgi:hypothetical protein
MDCFGASSILALMKGDNLGAGLIDFDKSYISMVRTGEDRGLEP